MRCDLRYWVGVVGMGATARARCQLRAGHAGDCVVLEPMTQIVCKIDQENSVVPLPEPREESIIQAAQRARGTNA